MKIMKFQRKRETYIVLMKEFDKIETKNGEPKLL